MNKTHLLHITTLSPEGAGQALFPSPDGRGGEVQKAVLVPYTLPEEKVEVEVRRHKSKSGVNHLGCISSVVQPSPLRVVQKCKHFGSCGGCVFQHMPYESQLTFKEQKIRKLFEELPEEAREKTTFSPILPCADTWQYRNKMEFSFSQDRSGQKFLGLFLHASKGRVLNVEECHLVHPWMSITLEACRSWWNSTSLAAYHASKNSGTLRTITFRHAITTGDRVVMLTVSGNPDFAIKKSDLDQFVSSMKQAAAPEENGFLTIVLRIQQITKGKPTQFYEMRLHGPDVFREKIFLEEPSGSKELEFQVSPSSFFQPNSKQASLIYSKALSLAGLSKDQVLYDLYAGIGIFGMCASHLVKQVISVELSPDSSYDATCNVNRLNLSNVTVCRADVAELLAKRQEFPDADVAIIDPPRSGLGKKAIQQMVILAPKTVVYVSCNPATQVQDIKELIQAGYRLESVQPVDQFPQTIHVENIAILRL